MRHRTRAGLPHPADAFGYAQMRALLADDVLPEPEEVIEVDPHLDLLLDLLQDPPSGA